MRAHFAGDVVVASNDDSCDAIETEPLETRINDFKQDSQNMEVLSEFIDDVLEKAEKEAVKKKQDETGSNKKASQQTKEKSRQSFTIPDFKNGKVVNRARGLVVRIFDAICNCANSAAAPAQRMKMRGKRASAKEQTSEPEKMQQSKEQEKQQSKVQEKQQTTVEAGEQKQ